MEDPGLQDASPPAPLDTRIHPFTVVVTSCGRFDLLRETLNSLLAHIDAPPAAIVVIEDSGDERVRDAVAGLSPPVEVVLNQPQLGQMRSIDKAYAYVKTPYAFHCEDDWLFIRGGFIAESFLILNNRPDVSTVGLRPREELNPLVRQAPKLVLGGVEYFIYDPSRHPEYFSYSFNPGLRRMSDIHALGPFAPLGHEADVSYAFKKAGFRLANVEQPAVTHMGDGRHVPDPTQPKRATSPWERFKRSVNKRLKRLRRVLNIGG